ncbi:MAG: M20/M25/M40 family metallo-hydrolase [Longimicrobiales bacterium]|nr:M20/M25/M40 family metallo-hydrolase [Longimicrobiales bacterium]
MFTKRTYFVLLFCTLAVGVAAPLAAQSGPEVARTHREANEPALVRDFAELLSYPNRAHTPEIREAAVFIQDRMNEVGVDTRLVEIDGVSPLILGVLEVPGATRTIGIYVHYDGQPVDPSNWTHDPFDPTLYSAPMEAGGEPIDFPNQGETVDPEWRLYARSAGDDKAPIAAILPVLQSFADAGVTPTSNLVFMFDGEEEAGSRNLATYMEMEAEVLDKVDIWLFFDGPAHASGRPQVVFGVRGSFGMEVTVYGATRNLHSGHYGNWAPDTGNILSRLLTSMKDDEGNVLVDGWYDGADPIGPEEQAALDAMPEWDEQLKQELGLVWSEGEPQSLPERLMVPALNIRGITSGNTGSLARNVIPNTAVAALGIRMVKGNTTENLRDLILAHVEGQGFHVVAEDPDMETRLRYPRIAKVTGGRGGSIASRTSMANPFAQSILAAATSAADRAFSPGALVVAPGMGGTLPLYLFSDIAGKPAVVVPVANHDNNQHAPDENLRIANLWYAIDLYAAIMTMPATIF